MKLRRIYYNKYLSNLPFPELISDFDTWVLIEEAGRIDKEREKNIELIEELPPAFPEGEEPGEPEDRFEKPLEPWE